MAHAGAAVRGLRRLVSGPPAGIRGEAESTPGDIGSRTERAGNARACVRAGGVLPGARRGHQGYERRARACRCAQGVPTALRGTHHDVGAVWHEACATRGAQVRRARMQPQVAPRRASFRSDASRLIKTTSCSTRSSTSSPRTGGSWRA